MGHATHGSYFLLWAIYLDMQLMKNLFTAFITILLVQAALQAQPARSHKPLIQSISSIGLLNGSSGSSFMLQSTIGYSLKHSFAGAGAALDLYKFRSIPLFVDLRQELGRKKRNLFLYGQGGYNLPWVTDQQKNKLPFSGGSFTGSWYYDAGLGYRIRINTQALLLSAGYSYKELRTRGSGWICTGTSCGITEQRYRYQMPRVVIKAGWQF